MERQIVDWYVDYARAGYTVVGQPLIGDSDTYNSRGRPCAEIEHIPDERFLYVLMDDHDCPDLYTTIGSFVIWQADDDTLTYLDVYNWQAGFSWDFSASLPFLPFSITIRGKDSTLQNLGRVFITTGKVTLR